MGTVAANTGMDLQADTYVYHLVSTSLYLLTGFYLSVTAYRKCKIWIYFLLSAYRYLLPGIYLMISTYWYLLTRIYAKIKLPNLRSWICAYLRIHSYIYLYTYVYICTCDIPYTLFKYNQVFIPFSLSLISLFYPIIFIRLLKS